MNMKTTRVIAAAGLLVCGLPALSAQTTPEFDAASLKPARQSGPAAGAGGTFGFYSGCSGGPGTTDTGRFACTAVTLRTLIQRAWNLRSYQVAGPGTMDNAQYDIEARVPEGTNPEQFRQMLQNLISGRFHLAVHHEMREQEVYELSVARGGHKLRTPQAGDSESARDALTKNSDGDGKGQKEVPFGDPNLDSKAAAMLSDARAQLAMMRAGRAESVGGRPPSHIASSTVNGLTRLAGRKATIAELLDFLSNQLGRPVANRTQLEGEWNFDVEYAAEGRTANVQMSAAMSQLKQAMPVADSAPNAGDAPVPSGGLTMASAFQKQLGLKLEAAKGPVDTVVVDKFDKVPAEN